MFLGSKEALDIASASSLNGSYTSILGWLKAHSKEKIKIPQTTDVIPFFDNNHVLNFFIIFFFLQFTVSIRGQYEDNVVVYDIFHESHA